MQKSISTRSRRSLDSGIAYQHPCSTHQHQKCIDEKNTWPKMSRRYLACLALNLLAIFCSNHAMAQENQPLATAFNKSYQYEKVADWDNAINVLLSELEHVPKDYTINLRLGYLYASNGKYANSINYYQVARKLCPMAIPPKLGLMRVMNIQARYADSEVLGYAILQNDLYNYYANLYLAYALRMDHNWQAAEQINVKMLAAYPSDKFFLLEYGLLTYVNNKLPAAIKALNYLLLLDPENITAKKTLAYVQKNNSAQTTPSLQTAPSIQKTEVTK